MNKASQRAHERMMWVLHRLAKKPYRGSAAWDEEEVDDFVEAFPEARATLRLYTLGPNCSPMLNRAARRAHERGYLAASSLGNMDARSYNQRTWCRYWKLTTDGLALVGRGWTVGDDGQSGDITK